MVSEWLERHSESAHLADEPYDINRTRVWTPGRFFLNLIESQVV